MFYIVLLLEPAPFVPLTATEVTTIPRRLRRDLQEARRDVYVLQHIIVTCPRKVRRDGSLSRIAARQPTVIFTYDMNI